jgi:antitoxin YefM
VPFGRRDAGIDEDQIEDIAVEPPAQRRHPGIVVDVDRLNPERAAGLLGQGPKPALAGHVARGRDDIPAALPQFRRQPQPQPARRADDERQAWFGCLHHSLIPLTLSTERTYSRTKEDASMETVSYSELRQNLKRHLDKVCDDRAPLVVTRRNGEPVVVLALSEYESLEETLHLLSNPANAERLLRSIAQADAGQLVEHEIIE